MQFEESEEIIVTEEEAGERIDKVLANRFRDIQSRTYFQFLLEEKRVLVNGLPIKKRDRVQAGDEVHIHFILTPEIGLEAECIPLEILYEDRDILVINKSKGMVVHPAPGHWSGTFVNALLYHCKQGAAAFSSETTDSFRPGIVHRLDKDTTGVLVAAKTTLSQQRLIEMFAGRQIHKEYTAICLGNPGNQEVRVPIGRHPVNRKLMTVRNEGGREAVSRFKTKACNGKLSLVNVILETGRTHQIRVHMKHVGAPILGDAAYGNVQSNLHYSADRQMLHAHLIRFKHPISGELLEFKAPFPSDMQDLITKHFRFLFKDDFFLDY